jgi:DNA-directed RNA polymerase specialized sigma24 family protein
MPQPKLQRSSSPDSHQAGDSAFFASTTPRWPVRLQELCWEFQYPSNGSTAEVREELWLLLNSVIARYVRLQAASLGRFSQEDLEDLVAQKSLDLYRRAESGRWDPSDRLPCEVASYMSKVARNGLLTLRERERRTAGPASGMRVPGRRRAREYEEPRLRRSEATEDAPNTPVERRDYARALIGCAGQFSARVRLMWILRAFLNMTTREIAAHPEVDLRPGHVDALLSRARQAVRECMRARGHDPSEMPAGTFVELWKDFRLAGRDREHE